MIRRMALAVQSLVRLARSFTSHPLTRKQPLAACGRFLAWQVASRIDRGIHVRPFVSGTRLAICHGMHAATANIYVGLMEFAEMGFTLHMLRSDDLFVDVGANVGTYCVIASGACQARSLAIEPNPASLAALERNIALNGLETRVRIAPMAAGAKAGRVAITTSLDSLNHVAEAGETAPTLDVPVDRLDHLVGDDVPILMKIDVEGFESEVLAGAERLLGDQRLEALIIELNGSGARYGFSDAMIHARLVGFGFAPCLYDPLTRCLTPVPSFGSHNTIYVRDIASIAKRVATAAPFTVLGRRI
ncbi:MAG: FkbM family methyltransferase [Alphaproteobacteria bacterium]